MLSRPSSIPALAAQLARRCDRVLPAQLPYESTPGPARRCAADAGTVVVQHQIWTDSGHDETVVASGFALASDAASPSQAILTCAHPFEQVGRSVMLFDCCYDEV